MRRAAGCVALALSLLVIALPAAGDLVDRNGQPPQQPENPAECGGDRIAGVWRGPRGRFSFWNYQVTLHIQRASGSAITGRMVGVWWTGSRRRPPPCEAGQTAFQVTQPAQGTFENNRFAFRATSYRIDRVICGAPTSYSPDHFVGTLDENASILRTVNNDGGNAVNDPEVFRRIRCR